MHEIISPSQLKARLEAVGLSVTRFAAKAGLHHSTLLRIINGGNCEVATLVTIQRELVAYERQLQAHLNQLHAPEAADA